MRNSKVFKNNWKLDNKIDWKLDNEIDSKIDVTAIQFLLVQNRHQTHG